MYPAGDDVQVFGPFQLGALRIFLAGLVLLPIAFKYKSFLNKKNFWLIAVTGLFGNLLPAMMFTLAETNIDSSLAGLLNMSTSFWVVLIGIFFFQAKPTKWQLLGLALGSTGLYLVLSGQFDASGNKDARYAFFLFPATLGYAVSLTIIKFKLSHVPTSAITSLSFFLIMIPAAALCFILNAFHPIFNAENGLEAFGYISILSIIGTALAVFLFTKLIAISNHIFSSAVAYVLPIVATLMGVADGEEFPLINILWIAIILFGVFLMSKANKPRQK